MNGATTDPCVKTIREPINTIVTINGASQYFLRTLKKSHISLARSKKASMVKHRKAVPPVLFDPAQQPPLPPGVVFFETAEALILQAARDIGRAPPGSREAD